MDEKEALGHQLKAVLRELDHRPDRCLSEEEWIDYQQGRLAENERADAQAHLVYCRACRESFQMARDFFDATREDEQPISDATLDGLWKNVRRRLRRDAAGASGRKLFGWSLGPIVTLTVAASFVAAVLLAGYWALELRRERAEWVRQADIQANRWAEQQKQHDQETRRLEEKIRTYEGQLAERTLPQTNIPIYDLFSRTSVRGSGGPSKPTTIAVPPTARSFLLVLNGGGQPDYPEYSIEIVDAQGQFLWQKKGLRRGDDGNFVLTLDRAFLREGIYHIRIYSEIRERPQRVAEYVFHILH